MLFAILWTLCLLATVFPFFVLFAVLSSFLLVLVLQCDHQDEEGVASCFACRWFIARVLSIAICLLFLSVSLVGFVCEVLGSLPVRRPSVPTFKRLLL